MNVRNFEIHEVDMSHQKLEVATSNEVATAKTFKLKVSNIHNVLLQYN
jgi:hypothetical protein